MKVRAVIVTVGTISWDWQSTVEWAKRIARIHFIEVGFASVAITIPRVDPQFDDIEDPFHKLRCMRGVMHGDHLERKSDGGKDIAQNIQTLCCRCHMIKTYKEKDYLAGKPLDALEE